MLISLALLGGLVLLAVGAEALARGGAGAARGLSLSPAFAGVLLGVASSMPELSAGLTAVALRAPDMAVGGAVGSTIVNLLLVLGATSLISPLRPPPSVIRREVDALGLAAGVALMAAIAGFIDMWFGLLLLLLLGGYVAWAWHEEERRPAAEAPVPPPGRGLGRNLIMAAAGLGLLACGAAALAVGAAEMARAAGLSQTTAGLTVLAAGGALPELAVCLAAALRRRGEAVAGVVVGAGVCNLLGVLGATAIVSPLRIPPQIVRLDLWVLLAAVAALVACLRLAGEVRRAPAAGLLAAYAAYVAWLVLGASAA